MLDDIVTQIWGNNFFQNINLRSFGQIIDNLLVIMFYNEWYIHEWHF